MWFYNAETTEVEMYDYDALGTSYCKQKTWITMHLPNKYGHYWIKKVKVMKYLSLRLFKRKLISNDNVKIFFRNISSFLCVFTSVRHTSSVNSTYSD